MRLVWFALSSGHHCGRGPPRSSKCALCLSAAWLGSATAARRRPMNLPLPREQQVWTAGFLNSSVSLCDKRRVIARMKLCPRSAFVFPRRWAMSMSCSHHFSRREGGLISFPVSLIVRKERKNFMGCAVQLSERSSNSQPTLITQSDGRSFSSS